MDDDNHRLLTVLQWNINGVRGRKAYLEVFLAHHQVDICLLQETRHCHEVPVSIRGYQVFSLAPEGRGRGLITLVRDDIPASRLSTRVNCGEEVETLGVNITLRDTSLLTVNLYRPAASSLELDEVFTDASERLLLIGGDFNAHHPVLSSTSPRNAAGVAVADALAASPGMQLLNSSTPTHVRGGILDLTFISKVLVPHISWAVMENIASDHFGIITTLDLPLLPPTPPPPPRWILDKADWPKFLRLMEDWASIDHQLTLDDMAEEFAEAVIQAANAAIPKSSHTRSSRRMQWCYSPEVGRLRHQLNQAKRAFRRSRTPTNLAILQEVAQAVKEQLATIRTEKWLEWCQEVTAHTSTSDIWRWLRRVAGKRRERPPSVVHPVTEANRLAVLFATRAAPSTLPPDVQDALLEHYEMRQRLITEACSRPSDLDTPITLNELRAAHKEGKDTAPGHDGVTYSLLSRMGPAAELSLLQLYNMSLTAGRVPKTWKRQITVPIPKRGDMTNPRPISLLSCINKVMERVLLPRLQHKVGPLASNVYAFSKGVGTQECITDMLSHIGRGPALAVFVDLDKAYERVNPTVILYLLAQYGVSGRTLQWLADYLTDRSSQVRLQGTLSGEVAVVAGTPQGSILSPFLFNLIIHELAQMDLPGEVRMFCYADDLAFTAVGSTRVADLANALDVVSAKCRELGLLINPTKSTAMAIRCARPDQPVSLGGVALGWEATHCYLGILIDDKLTFDAEVDYLRTRAAARSQPLRYLTGLRAGANQTVLQKFYMAAVRSLVDYAAPSLVRLTERQRKKLEVIQNNALRPILGAPIWAKVHALRLETGCHSLQARVTFRICGIATKALSSGRPSIFGDGLRDVLTRPPARPGIRFYQNAVASHLRRVGATLLALELTPDIPPNYCPSRPPWQQVAIQSTSVLLPRPKALCSPQDIDDAVRIFFNSIDLSSGDHLFTDGSVNETLGTAGVAYVWRDVHHSWSISAPCSSTFAELVAIRQAMRAAVVGTSNVTIYTDSKAARAAVLQKTPKSHIAVTSEIRHLADRMAWNGRSVTIAWIPGHAGVAPNVRADVIARAATHIPHVTLRTPLQRSMVTGKVRASLQTCQESDYQGELRLGSPSLQWWTTATERRPTPVDKYTPRWVATIISRLRIGYKCSWEVVERSTRDCSICGADTSEALWHYLLDCPNTQVLRHGRPPIVGLTRAAAAAVTARHVVDHISTHMDFLKQVPPPR